MGRGGPGNELLVTSSSCQPLLGRHLSWLESRAWDSSARQSGLCPRPMLRNAGVHYLASNAVLSVGALVVPASGSKISKPHTPSCTQGFEALHNHQQLTPDILRKAYFCLARVTMVGSDAALLVSKGEQGVHPVCSARVFALVAFQGSLILCHRPNDTTVSSCRHGWTGRNTENTPYCAQANHFFQTRYLLPSSADNPGLSAGTAHSESLPAEDNRFWFGYTSGPLYPLSTRGR